MDQPPFYYFSPFDAGVDESTRITAATVLIVYSSIFLAGLIGHVCVLCFCTSRPSRKNTPLSSAYVIIASCSVAQCLYICTCLPAIAFKSAMALVTSEWLLGDVACRLASFLEVALLGVTALSFCALAIDRLAAANHVTRDCDVTREWCGRAFCKMLALWLLAVILASPEVLLMEAAQEKAAVPGWRGAGGETSGELVLDRREYSELLAAKSLRVPDVFQSLRPDGNNSMNVRILVSYERCLVGRDWGERYPPLLAKFMEFYAAFRHWYLLCFTFAIPILVCMVLGFLVARRLSKAVTAAGNQLQAASNHSPASEAGTLPLRGQDFDLAPIVENGNYPTDSLPSNRTFTSDSLFQQRVAVDRQLSQSSYMQYHSRLAPLLSSEDLTENETSPVMKIANGSLRSAHRHFMSEAVPLSPVAPSVACMSGVSVTSLAFSNNPGHGTLGAASLPPHGHGKSTRRRSCRIQRQTLNNVSRQRALNFFVAIALLVFALTQLPARVGDILRIETAWFSGLAADQKTVVADVALYMSSITFAVNPIVMFFCYKAYRMFLLGSPCCC